MIRNIRNTMLGFTTLALALPGRAADAPESTPAETGPASVTVTCGDTRIRIDGPKMWTLSLLQYQGTVLGIEDSAYGSVFGFSGADELIGSAHWFNGESEQVRLLRWELDGRPLARPSKNLKGREFRLYKESTIRQIAISTNIELKDNRIYETVVVRSADAIPLKLNYHFMHAFTPSAGEFLAGRDDGFETGETLRDSEEVNRKFYLNQPIDWLAVYDEKSGRGAVSRLLEQPAGSKATSKLWNVPGIYRKFYYDAFPGETLPAGFNGKYRMVTAFFSAEPARWKEVVHKLSNDLKSTRQPLAG